MTSLNRHGVWTRAITRLVLMGAAATVVPVAMADGGHWYRGDLHMHSTHSDGDSSVADLIEASESLGLDFIAITDHDTSMNGIPTQWGDSEFFSTELSLLHGVEWTTGLGHANVWADYAFDYTALWDANRAGDMDGAVRAAHDQGVAFSINHPSAFGCCAWEYEGGEPVDAIEIWNGTYRAPGFNGQSTHEFWDSLLVTGGRVTAVGGSDTHELQSGLQPYFWTVGNPTTWVFAEANTPEALLAGILAGNVSVSYDPQAPRVELWADADMDGIFEVKMGEAVTPQASVIDFRVQLVDPVGQSSARKGRATPMSVEALRALGREPLVQRTPGELLRATSVEPRNVSGDRENDCGKTHVVGIFRDGELVGGSKLECGADTFTFREQSAGALYYRVEVFGIPELKPVQHLLYGGMTAISNPIYIR